MCVVLCWLDHVGCTCTVGHCHCVASPAVGGQRSIFSTSRISSIRFFTPAVVILGAPLLNHPHWDTRSFPLIQQYILCLWLYSSGPWARLFRILLCGCTFHFTSWLRHTQLPAPSAPPILIVPQYDHLSYWVICCSHCTISFRLSIAWDEMLAAGHGSFASVWPSFSAAGHAPMVQNAECNPFLLTGSKPVKSL